MYFFLIIIGIVLIALNVRRPKVQKVDLQLPFNEVLKGEEIDITELDIIVGELRAEFSETILELQRSIMDMRVELDSLGQGQKTTVLKKPVEHQIVTNVEPLLIEDQGNNKINEICKLLKKDFSIDEVCEKFEMGRGEILLIKELYLK